MENDINDTRMLTTGKAAELCSVTPDTVLKWIHSGRLPAIRTPGGHHRVLAKDLKAMIKGEQTTKSFSPLTTLKPRHHHFRYCWEFNGNGELLEGCRECVVYLMRAKRCYEVIERAKEIGHNKVFCKQSCENCEYYKTVHQQQNDNVLVVTDNELLAADLKRGAYAAGFTIEVSHCEYTASALIDMFRPDYAIIDCSLGKTRTRDICDHLTQDPRIPFVKVVLAAGQGEFPAECDKIIFARIEKPFGVEDLAECIGTVRDEERSPTRNVT